MQNKFILFTLPITLLLINYFTIEKKSHKSIGKIEIRFTNDNSGYTINDTIFIPTFEIVIKNNSDSTANFYEEWNMWGYYNFYLKVKKGNDYTNIYRKRRTSWDKNYPAFQSLKHGDSMLIEFPKNCEYQWDGFECIPEKFNGAAKIIIVHDLIKENHHFNDLLSFLGPFYSKKNDSLEVQEIYNKFPDEKISSREFDCEINNGNFRILEY